MKYTNDQLEAISKEAFTAASFAAKQFIEENGEIPYCGFAWVNITPGNCQIANYLKKINVAQRSYARGVDVWNPSQHGTQSMDVKEAGAQAFADVLRKYGFSAYMESRAD